MSGKLHIDPQSATPIWSQIEDGLRHLVASGALAPGAVVPSVRDLARELRVNPATVSKAYQRLTDAGTLEVRRGDGTYVASAPPEMSRAVRSRALREGALRFASLAVTMGVTRKEAAAELEAAMADLERRHKGKEG
jgi:GntR family transcriptional regulator